MAQQAQIPTEIQDAVENYVSKVDECPSCDNEHETSNPSNPQQFFFEIGRPVFIPFNEPSGEGLEGPLAVPIVCKNCREMMFLNPQ